MLINILIIVGTLMVWFPLLLPIVFSFVSVAIEGIFRFDYLMPAEIFPVELIGAGLLFWVSFRKKLRKRLIGWSICIAVLSLVIGQLIAIVTGLASGEIETNGWQWTLVVTSIAIFWLSLVSVGIGGILLLRDVFFSSQSRGIKQY
ncbi:MAG: hypothetical protein V1858_01015 [Candidatus Gottesmanbacteria bacterium]